MYSFMNDYSEGAHPQVLDLMIKANLEQNGGYGQDIHSEKAKEYMKKAMEREDADIHFIPGGTQSNLLVIGSFLRPHQCVISADTGHITGHESGAIEATGHKVISVPCKEGKLTPYEIQRALEENAEEYTPQPKMVYISNSTELGSLYSKAELEALHAICKEKDLLLFMDGARLGSALMSEANDLALKDIARLVDVFYIGGTKNGALLGEAIVILRDELKTDFRILMKQRGAMMAKGFVLGIQFEALFQDNLYFDLARHANKMAEKIASSLEALDYTFYEKPVSNQLFITLPNTLLEKLSKEFKYTVQEKLDKDRTVIRLVTSWATTEESVDALIEFFKKNR
ncbi:aminotransferase class I/II-fold pyridoxal phosphate-dependent enzyme [Irregularibacter muris]|uniref:Aminotransferase class I/II-fold pyridoxal phosphate-dependent enzyme n=1 Tax=Irregularibacter muris TaxID=1796619 RepID=A0AAE3HF40_9FIRM|nr:aminotransferase class I/II-fold pyridoxal phosphate-dependent enzyme [Irregularibacter muris]MCR1898355.1 aminotransferase class I/II-fold pyridoxal phosphate-dependent enzyme [Irregularibacter muris]